jgi:hypothetical protein
LFPVALHFLGPLPALRTRGPSFTTDAQIGRLVNAALEAIELPLDCNQVTDRRLRRL